MHMQCDIISSGLMATQGAATYVVTMDYALHSLWNGYFNVGGNKEDPIPYVTKLELTCISVQGGIVYPYED